MSDAMHWQGGLLTLLRPFRNALILSGLCGAVAAVATVGLLAGVNNALNQPARTGFDGLWLLLALCAVAVAGQAASDILTNLVGQRLVADVRRVLARRIITAPIDALERYRTHRLIPVLTHDVDMISDFAFVFASLAISIAVMIGCLVYLAWLSMPLFGAVAFVLGIGCAVQYAARNAGLRGFDAARSAEDLLHKGYEGISEGAKELRMNRGRRARFFEARINRTIDEIQTINARAISIFVLSNAAGSLLFFSCIALAFFWAAMASMGHEVLSGFVLVLVFLKGPVEQILQSVPPVIRAQVAFKRITDLSGQFRSPELRLPQIAVSPSATDMEAFSGLELRGVTYAFPAAAGGQPFTLGPVDLSIDRGEMLFLVGDNGSGKTTFIKLLLGLYTPQSGTVSFNAAPVTAENRDDYRQHFTTVFSDYYLFEEVGDGAGVLPSAAAPYLQRLEIAHKVRVEDGVFTTIDLSSGQRKRLALVQAYLERRPVVVFDEWAADQDPAFRKLFYTELLPDLKAQGRTLIVISHDDRYFSVADRVIRMEEGRIVDMFSPSDAVSKGMRETPL